MRVKVDEDLPGSVVALLRRNGHSAEGVREQGMGGWADEELWPAVQAENRFLVTAYKGFANVVTHPPGTHMGILLLRPDEDGPRPVLDLLDRVLASFPLDSLVGCVAVAGPRGVRVRRPEPD